MKYLLTQTSVLLIGLLLFSCNQNSTSTTQADEKVDTVQKATTPADTSVTTTDPADLMQAYGVDISKFQGDEVDYLNEKKDSLHFIICKATEGVTYTDPEFQHNWQDIPAKGFIRGAYHFFRSNDDPVAQAKFFTQTISDLKATDVPPIVDFEKGGIKASQSAESVANNLLVMLKTVEQETNRKPIIYVNIGDGDKYLTDSAFAEYPLWVANYTRRDHPNLPSVWKEKGWNIWQKSESYKVGSNTNDFDIFNGTVADLKEFIQRN